MNNSVEEAMLEGVPRADLIESFKDFEERKNITVHTSIESLFDSLNS